MADVHIPDAVFQKIERVLPERESADEFVLQAVRDKLTFEDHKREFYRLSDLARAAMTKKGLTEADILAEFEARRHSDG